jgi:hypothetical protein
MLATFCLRLAAGLAGALLLLPARQVNPRFYRAHLLTVLGLSVAAGCLLSGSMPWALGIALGAAALLAFVGSVVWSLEGAPAGVVLSALTAAALAAALVLSRSLDGESRLGPLLADDFTSAALLGTATTAMLVGHSYLTAPAMTLVPLFRLLIGLFVALVVRAVVSAGGVWFWTAGASSGILSEVSLFLTLRWAIGLVAPLVLGMMAWHTTRIRSTQSATGILYVVVIFCFLGELISQVVSRMAGTVL